MSLIFLIQRPIAILTLFGSLFLLSILATPYIPTSLLPESTISKITIQIRQNGLSAKELDRDIVQTIRTQLLRVDQLKDIKSITYDEQSTIELDFEIGTDIHLAFMEVNEKLDQVRNHLPLDLEHPKVLKSSMTDIPVFYLSIIPKVGVNNLEISSFVLSVLKRRIEQLSQVAFVDVSGYASPQISIIPKENKLLALGLQEKDIIHIIKQNNIDLGHTLIQEGHYKYPIRFHSTLRYKEDIEQIYFWHSGRIFQLKDIATVVVHTQKRQGKFLFNGKEAIILSVRKKADSQLFALNKEFKQLLQSFQIDYPELEFKLTNDQSKLLEISISNLKGSLAYGALFALATLFIFFSDFSKPLLVVISIPIALMLTLLGFYVFHISINIISLSGLILGIGLMIDNSIIIIENIYQHTKMDKGWELACVDGANEVIRPLISSALTTCAVFFPLLFLSGLAGALFYEQAISILLSLGMSLCVAYLLIPTLLNLLGQNFNKQGNHLYLFSKLSFWVTHVIHLCSKFKGLIILFLFGSISMGSFFFYQLSKKIFPDVARTELACSIDWNAPITLEENENRIWRIIEKQDTMINQAIAFLGKQQFLLQPTQQSSNEAKILFFADRFTKKFDKQLKEIIKSMYPEATIDVAPVKNIFDHIFGSEKAPLIIHLQNRNNNDLPSPTVLKRVVDYLNAKEQMVDMPILKMQYEIQVLSEKALLYEVDLKTIYQKLRLLFNSLKVSTLQSSNILVPIFLRGTELNFFDEMEKTKILNNRGDWLPLSSFVKIDQSQDYKMVVAGKGNKTVNLAIQDYHPFLIREIDQFLQSKTDLVANYSGQIFENRKIITELSFILLITLLLLYLILAIQFESLLQPLIIILSVPIGLSGALITLYYFGQSLSIVSVTGMILLSGIIVNDAILKVDMINRLRDENPLKEAICIATERRLKPIVLTTVTTVLALLPILFAQGMGAELQRPLAYAIIGGLAIGTVVNLFIIPTFYLFLTKA